MRTFISENFQYVPREQVLLSRINPDRGRQLALFAVSLAVARERKCRLSTCRPVDQWEISRPAFSSSWLLDRVGWFVVAFNSDVRVRPEKSHTLPDIATSCPLCPLGENETRSFFFIGKRNRDKNDSADSSLNRSFHRIGYQVRGPAKGIY